MNTLASLVSMILAVSVATERIGGDILKGALPNFWLFKTNPDSVREAQRCACIHVLSGCLGALVAGISHLDIFTTSSSPLTAPSWAAYAVAGICRFCILWNHALDIIKASKVNQEQSAISAVNTNQQMNLVSAAHPASFSPAMARLPWQHCNPLIAN